VSDPIERLQAIQERMDLHEIEGRTWEAAYRTDGRMMLAALRAVLDFTVSDNTPIWVGIALDEIITEALGGAS
jgi:hypothetical protein